MGYKTKERFPYTQLTPFVARGPRASQCRLYRKTSNQVNLVLYPKPKDLRYKATRGYPERI